ncbi:MAG: 50S ribosomal protein L14e [Candidatus Jordarchaeales archaeon]
MKIGGGNVALRPGSICVKTAGREAGKKCVVVDILDKNFVLITGPPALSGVKRRRANIKHLEATGEYIDIPKGADDELVLKKLEEAGLAEKIKERIKI